MGAAAPAPAPAPQQQAEAAPAPRVVAAAAAVTAPPPIRGYCHQCELEVVPRCIDGGEFECPHCNEPFVESPYESYEHWQGSWRLRYTNGHETDLNIDEAGRATLAARSPGEGTGSAQLTWAPLDHDGFLMRLEGHGRPGVREYLRLRQGAGGPIMDVRRESSEDGVMMGRAQRVRRGGLAGPQTANVNAALINFLETMNRLAENDGADEAMPGAGGAAAHGGASGGRRTDIATALSREIGILQQAMLQSPERQQAGGQGAGVHAHPLANMIAQNRSLMQSLAQQLDQDAARSPGIVFVGQGGTPLRFNFQNLGVLFGESQQQAPHNAVSEPAAAEWLSKHALVDATELETDWQCPICFDDTRQELVALCRDEKGKMVHAFHHECIKDWLVKRDECPTCRRTPVVAESGPEARRDSGG